MRSKADYVVKIYESCGVSYIYSPWRLFSPSLSHLSASCSYHHNSLWRHRWTHTAAKGGQNSNEKEDQNRNVKLLMILIIWWSLQLHVIPAPSLRTCSLVRIFPSLHRGMAITIKTVKANEDGWKMNADENRQEQRSKWESGADCQVIRCSVCNEEWEF